jgi:hypothetical protein
MTTHEPDPGVLSLGKRREHEELRAEVERLRQLVPAQALDIVPGAHLHLCWRSGVVLDETTRAVTCKGCKATRDAFDVLLEYAKRDRNFMWTQKHLRDEEKRLRAEVETLRKERTACRAAIRRSKKKGDD